MRRLASVGMANDRLWIPAERLHRFDENPADAYDTGKGVRSVSGDNIICEIRTSATSIGSKTDAQSAKIDIQLAKIDSKLDALTAKIDSLRWMIVVLFGLVTLLAILGFLVFIGPAEPVSDPCVHLESTGAFVHRQAIGRLIRNTA